jgi:regulator of sigma E protease
LETLNIGLNIALSIVKVAVGLGVVIFIHELGHFLMAKWNDVKVEKFSIGFGPTIFGFVRGETQYVLAAVPLGGFVKMLGEGPEEEANKSTDPRAYPNKPVSARMAIISAGVIMNLFFGWICFSYSFTQSRSENPGVMGAIAAGSPAYAAGLRSGDEISAIDGRRDPSFITLMRRVSLSGRGHVLHLEVKRPGVPQPLDLFAQPRREDASDRPTIGIRPAESLIIAEFEPPAGMVDAPEYPPIPEKERLNQVDVLVAAAVAGHKPAPLADSPAYDRLLAENVQAPIVHRIERRPYKSRDTGSALETFELTLPPVHVVDFGFRLTTGPLTAIRKDSPAERAGFREGDLIVKVDGRDDFDPMRLPAYCFDKAGTAVAFEVKRKVASGEIKVESITVTPDHSIPRMKPALLNEPVDIAGLGLCYPVKTTVAAVRDGSPAARAGIKPGDVITSLKIPQAAAKPGSPRRADRNAPKERTIELDEKSAAWLTAFAEVQSRPVQQIELFINNASQPVTLTPEPDPNWYSYTRGLLFYYVSRKVPPQDLATALRSGFHEAVDNVLEVYATFRSLAERQVSPKNLGGPLMIVGALYSAADSGFSDLIFILGFINVALAVFNFLPIPPLDGGQMAFLIAEKVRGRPLPDSAMIASTYFGLLMVLCLMVYVTFQDIVRFVNAWFS